MSGDLDKFNESVTDGLCGCLEVTGRQTTKMILFGSKNYQQVRLCVLFCFFVYYM